jgi:endo-1,4-beta-D-glucanase Y
MRLSKRQSGRQSARATSSLLLVLVGVLASVAVPDARAGTKKDGAGAASGQLRYYDGMLYLLSLLRCSGQFRIWTPR